MDTYTKKIVRVDRLATGGKEDGLAYGTHKKNILDHCSSAEYVPELLSQPMRTDVKPLNVTQPEGPSFQVDGNLVQWQKWRFRIGFNPREGATLHDVRYDGRSVLYRLSLSEMTVPYGDPRPPFHRKQAFDFGDAGAGRAANNLALGCDCLGTIKYFDAVLTEADGTASPSKNVVCLHEQDNGIGWKHTNFRTDRAVVTRLRELVVQFIITLANYEYIFAYKLDQAGGITIETRATGIVSVVNIDPGKTSQWGNIVSPGALAQNHQHLFCIRIDPAIDGYSNTVVAEESVPMPMSKEFNPYGSGYEVKQRPITTSQHFDASPTTNLTVKMINPSKLNPISGKPVAYKFIPSASQLLLAHPDSIMAKRAQFAQHHVWVTKYKDGELWAGGEFTNQSKKEVDGVADAVARKENVENSDVVVWNVFGLTVSSRTTFICATITLYSITPELRIGPSCQWRYTKSTYGQLTSLLRILRLMSRARRTRRVSLLMEESVVLRGMCRRIRRAICRVRGRTMIPRASYRFAHASRDRFFILMGFSEVQSSVNLRNQTE